MKTIEEVKKTCTYHHTAAYKQYVSRKEEGVVSYYKGRFGKDTPLTARDGILPGIAGENIGLRMPENSLEFGKDDNHD